MPPDSCLFCGLFLKGACFSLPGEGMEKETSLLTHILSTSSFHIAFGSHAGEVRVTQSYSFRHSWGKPSARMQADNTPEGCERRWTGDVQTRAEHGDTAANTVVCVGRDGSLTLQTFSSASNSGSLLCTN